VGRRLDARVISEPMPTIAINGSRATLCIKPGRLGYLVFSLLLAGCASGWHRPAMTEAELSRDKGECWETALHWFPPVLTASKPGPLYETALANDCVQNPVTKSSNCSGRPSAAMAAPPTPQDGNAAGRRHAFDTCMESRGYRSKRQPD
jgi:hypothetical protein